MELKDYIDKGDELFGIISDMPEPVKNRCAIVRLQAGNILFYKGDLVEGIFILCKGNIKIMNIFSKGNVFIVSENDKSTFIGEQAILAGQRKASVTIEAVTDCTMIRIPIDAFLKWVDEDHALTKFLLRDLAIRLYPLSMEHGNRSYLSCNYLLEKYLVKVYEKSPEEEVRVMETRQTIADKLGISLRSVERGISTLKENGLLTNRKRKIFINEVQYHQLLELMED